MAIVHDKPIEDFWDWWTAVGRTAADTGIRDCAFGDFDGEMNARVEAMHADLAWELMPGRQAEHALVVTAAGPPGPGAVSRLRDFEDRLTGWLPPHVRLLAHETTRGTRTFHLYGDSDDPVLASQVRDPASSWPGATVRPGLDAGWRAIRHLTA